MTRASGSRPGRVVAAAPRTTRQRTHGGALEIDVGRRRRAVRDEVFVTIVSWHYDVVSDVNGIFSTVSTHVVRSNAEAE